MNKNLAIISGVFFVLLMVGMAYAADNQSNNSKTAYGQCVSQNAGLKNSCFATVKQTLESCKASAPQDDTKKDALKQCRLDYKTAKKQCKLTFKEAKKVCFEARKVAEAAE